MPVYEYRCRTCGSDFELRRPMSESSAPALCPDGHAEVQRRMSVVAAIGAGGAERAPAAAPCGPACACHPG